MTPVSRKSEQDDLKRLASLYERAPDVEPDARLDRAVLGRARQTAPRSGWVGPWAYGLTGALCLVLVIGLGLRQGLQVSEAPVETYEERKVEQPESEPSFTPQGGSPVSEIVSESLPPAQSRRRAAAELSQAQSAPSAVDAAGFFDDQEADPDSWFDRIRELLDEGHKGQAREALAAFREAHPDTDIPADLEEQLADAAKEGEVP